MSADVAEMNRMIALNVDALTRLTYAAVPAFVKRGAGAIINIASIVAIAPERPNGVYGDTKAFVLAFSHSLRHELANSGVTVQVVLPWATATNFWDKAGKPSPTCLARSPRPGTRSPALQSEHTKCGELKKTVMDA